MIIGEKNINGLMKFALHLFLILMLAAHSSCLSGNQKRDPTLEILKAKGLTKEKSLLLEEARLSMVEEQLMGRGLKDQRVLDVMSRIKREEFIPEDYQLFAYDDRAIPIAELRSIPQPYIIAVMVEALNLQSNDKVLEIGDGSGYQTAILAELSAEVYSIEPRPDLAGKSESLLTELGYDNVQIIIGDGRLGLPQKGSFDAIVFFAALEEVPFVLFEQLKEGGRLVVPLGGQLDEQTLTLFKKKKGLLFKTELGGVRFRILETYTESP
jgi:protein-L-isoaspartate(D-aspartate) O-methyltransferase